MAEMESRGEPASNFSGGSIQYCMLVIMRMIIKQNREDTKKDVNRCISMD